MGFQKANVFLESLLNERYHASLAPTLDLLENMCKKTEKELEAVRRELADKNPDRLSICATNFISAFVSCVLQLLEGSILGEPEICGQTLDEEKFASGKNLTRACVC